MRRQTARRAAAELALLAVAAPLLVSCAPPGSDAAPLPPSAPVVDVDMREYTFDKGAEVIPGAGQVVIRAHNRGNVEHELVVIQLPEDVPSLSEQLRGSERRAVDTVAILKARRPGERGVLTVDLRPGRYAFACFRKDAAGQTHARLGMALEFTLP